MEQALQEAYKAWDEGEVPVGAIIVHKNKIIARGHNRVESSKDSTAHAEIIAIGAASGEDPQTPHGISRGKPSSSPR